MLCKHTCLVVRIDTHIYVYGSRKDVSKALSNMLAFNMGMTNSLALIILFQRWNLLVWEHASMETIIHITPHSVDCRSLLKLNVESNELIGLPRSLLSLPLTHLLFSGNYTHPALWKENCRTPPQVTFAR